MPTTDFLSSLGAGASFSTKEIVSSLVAAERAPIESRIQSKIDDAETEISGLAIALESLNSLRTTSDDLKDAADYDQFSVTNSQSTALTISAGAGANAGNHSITVSAIAKAQTTNLMQTGSSEFTSASQLLNSGSSFVINIQIGGASGVTHPITVSTDTPQGIADAIDAADIGIDASLVDTGTAGSSYIIQLAGEQGSTKAFALSEVATSILSSTIPTGFDAADASISVNGISFTRSTNTIDDIVPGTTLNLNSVTSGAASVAVTRDTTGIKEKVVGFIEAYNSMKSTFDELTSAEQDGELRGDIVVRGLLRDLKGLLTNPASTPGTNLTRLTEIGISINRNGSFDINEATLDTALAGNFDDLKTLFSADTTDQSEIGTASRGIAGDLSKLINDVQASSGYLTTRTATLDSKLLGFQEDITDLDERMEKIRERYELQFLSMQKIIDEMDNTRDNLISSFENLPFTNRD